uniref:G-patch domain-containing protein n=1 Tax=Eptatretus burgeri TaxID=7764 RepID=A0A8C4QND5_EPTBU
MATLNPRKQSDSDSDEELAVWGRPLPPLEEGEGSRRVPDDTVRDERGRFARFHGAFTGGFSAGYFNSVGSKEGWVPSSFSSSRKQRGERKEQQAEDFMDEEDFGEHGIAPRRVVATDVFAREVAGEENERAGLATRASTGDGGTSPARGRQTLEKLVAPVRVGLGERLLSRLGWRLGQGVGPRLKRKPQLKRPVAAKSKMYGCQLPPSSTWKVQGGNSEGEEEDEDEEFAPSHATFAPSDMVPLTFVPLPLRRGLGYRGLDQSSLGPSFLLPTLELFEVDTKGSAQHQKKAVRIRGQAFGVGLADHDDDEDDPVYTVDRPERYDLELGGPEPEQGLGWTGPPSVTGYKRGEKHRPGTALPGFQAAIQPVDPDKSFSPPKLPRGYCPCPPFLAPGEAVSQVVPEVGTGVKGRHELDASQRAQMLEIPAQSVTPAVQEATTPKAPKSVFDLLSEADRSRLLQIRRGLHPAIPQPSQAPPGPMCPTPSPTVSATSVNPTFTPFTNDLGKQVRYAEFLQMLKAGKSEKAVASGLTEWEREREREEFAQAAAIFHPLHAAMAARFTSGSEDTEEDKVEVPIQEEADSSVKADAAKLKMFGKLTREELEWHPDQLLCKRFNVPDPYPGCSMVGLPTVTKDKFSLFNFLSAEAVSAHPQSQPQLPVVQAALCEAALPALSTPPMQYDSTKTSDLAARDHLCPIATPTALDPPKKVVEGSTPHPATTVSLNDGPSETSGPEGGQVGRPSMDLFRAIFANSSESDISEDDQLEEEEAASVKVDPTTNDAANHNELVEEPNKGEKVEAKAKEEEQMQEDLTFGPKLPPMTMPRPSTPADVNHPLQERSWRRHSKEHHHKETKVTNIQHRKSFKRIDSTRHRPITIHFYKFHRLQEIAV